MTIVAALLAAALAAAPAPDTPVATLAGGPVIAPSAGHQLPLFDLGLGVHLDGGPPRPGLPPLRLDGAAAPSMPTTPAPTPEAPAHPAAEAAAAATHHDSWFALPVLFWLPETKLGYGATGGLHFQLRDAERPSSVFGAAVYTLQRQGSLDVAGDLYLPGGALVSGRLRAIDFPDEFYGLGPDTRTSQREKFTRREVEAVVTAELPVPGVHGLRAGPRLDLRAEDIRGVQAGGALASGDVVGARGFSAVSAGASVTWDTRDNAFWTRRGSLAQAWYVYAPKGLGHHDPFGRGVLELRHFLPLGGGRVLGLQGYVEGAHGATPFTLLPKLGSTRFLRGIREGRYRDQLDWATQAELRVPLRGRLSAATFLSIGDVAHSFRDLTLASPKVAGGAGLRFRLTDAGANIRVDGAFSGAGPELYVLVLEAF